MGAMKSTGAVLSVQVETQGACGGQRLRGKVFLDVSKDMIPATSLNIQFYGVETTHVYNAFSGEDEPNYWEECHEFFGIEIALQNFHNECVTKGRYVFPFDFQLPVGLPGKQGVRTGTNDSFFVVEYFLQAHLHRNGNLVANAKNRTEVFLSDTPFVAYAKFPAFVEPITELIGSCCCGIVGSVTIAAHIDSTHVCIGEKLKIEYGVQNDSSKGLDAVEIRIREIRSFRAQGQNKEVIMELFSARIEAAKVAGAKPTGKKTAQSASAYELLQGHQSVDAIIPARARCSYRGVLGSVTHQVLVYVRVRGSLTRPVAIPFVVHQRGANFTGMVPFVEVPVAMPADWAAGAKVTPTASRSLLPPPPPSSTPDELVQRLQDSTQWLEANTLTDWLVTNNANTITPQHMGRIFGAIKGSSHATFASTLGVAMAGAVTTKHVVAAALASPRESMAAVCTGFAQHCVDKSNAPSEFLELDLPRQEQAYVLECYSKAAPHMQPPPSLPIAATVPVPVQAPTLRTLSVQVPPNALPGATIEAITPEGLKVRATIPPGAVAGQIISLAY